jgi:hypothetical protein
MAISDLVFLFPGGFVDHRAETVRYVIHNAVDRSGLQDARLPPTPLELAQLSRDATARLAESSDPMIRDLRAVFHARPDGALDVQLLHRAIGVATPRGRGSAARVAAAPGVGLGFICALPATIPAAANADAELDEFEADERTPPRLGASTGYRDRDTELFRLSERVATLEAQRSPRRLLAELDEAFDTMTDEEIEHLYAILERRVLRLAEALDRIKKRQSRR